MVIYQERKRQMKIQYQPMQTVTTNGKTYTVSLMNIDYGVKTKERPRQRYALVKTESGQYFVAEWSDSSWVGSDELGWSISGSPSISLVGTGKESGKEAVKWFEEVIEPQVKKMACR
jgi:hypothetical protein